ncbi:unnamed protein product [Trifolium pratense]|uniref:Uncharacterized protein n=1 Tax=Trifolium pratense TaxID=57577 RepID=A0ACB0MFE8_TRIPR|nr:unnamed protein product [Trifolium pratense]
MKFPLLSACWFQTPNLGWLSFPEELDCFPLIAGVEVCVSSGVGVCVFQYPEPALPKMKNFGRLGYIAGVVCSLGEWPGTPVLGGSQNCVTHNLQALIWLSLLRHLIRYPLH